MTSPSDADTMKIGAETAKPRKLIEGLDGPGWVEALRREPNRSLPGGAGRLIVEYLLDRPIGQC
jgi:hypothetical protein